MKHEPWGQAFKSAQPLAYKKYSPQPCTRKAQTLKPQILKPWVLRERQALNPREAVSQGMSAFFGSSSSSDEAPVAPKKVD